MKNKYLLLLLVFSLLLGGCTAGNPGSNEPETPVACESCKDDDANNLCDVCGLSVLVYVDFYAINDLHGKLTDSETQIGVDELTTYLKKSTARDDYAFLLSTGDMWQGTAESNITKGLMMTDWMNSLDFTAMSLGNHEFDWGEEYIEKNAEQAKFPILAINVFDRETNARVDYCDASVVVEAGELKIGIIGAIGDCYSSIASDFTKGIYFKVREELTKLVKEEADRLRKEEGVDAVVYLLHDGHGNGSTAKGEVASSQLKSFYDVSLSDGYVDLVFEGHTHQGYSYKDEHGVYHLQNRGDNSGGISHVELGINTVNGNTKVNTARLISTSSYANMEDDPIVEELLTKYEKEIAPTYEPLGTNSSYKESWELRQLVAELYKQTGMKKWGNEYDIVLGGGYISVRKPYNLKAGEVSYADLYSLFPFDNELVLCSIKGEDLLDRFIHTDNGDYFLSYTDFGDSVKESIDPEKTYYIVTDTYSSTYAPNKLTEIERNGATYARDLIAEYIKEGGMK